MTTFKLGTEFPREGFVQRCLERYFGEHGYQRTIASHTDFACVHPSSGEHWIVEAKGETTANVGLDFRTGLGQLLQEMGDPLARYGLAVPGTSKFFTQLKRVPDRVRTALQIHWLVVDETGEIAIIGPSEPTAGLGV